MVSRGTRKYQIVSKIKRVHMYTTLPGVVRNVWVLVEGNDHAERGIVRS